MTARLRSSASIAHLSWIPMWRWARPRTVAQCAYALLLIATLILWLRSYRIGDRWFVARGSSPFQQQTLVDLRVFAGRVAVGRMSTTWMGSGIWHTSGPPALFAVAPGATTGCGIVPIQRARGRKQYAAWVTPLWCVAIIEALFGIPIFTGRTPYGRRGEAGRFPAMGKRTDRKMEPGNRE